MAVQLGVRRLVEGSNVLMPREHVLEIAHIKRGFEWGHLRHRPRGSIFAPVLAGAALGVATALRLSIVGTGVVTGLIVGLGVMIQGRLQRDRPPERPDSQLPPDGVPNPVLLALADRRLIVGIRQPVAGSPITYEPHDLGSIAHVEVRRSVARASRRSVM